MNRNWPILLLILPLLFSCGDAAERALRRGNTRYRAGDNAGAMKAYASFPTDPRNRYNMGTVLLSMDSLPIAASVMREAAALGTPRMQALPHHNLGHALTRWAFRSDSTARALDLVMQQPDNAAVDITERLLVAVRKDSMIQERKRLDRLADSLLAAGVNAYKDALRRNPADEDSRHDLAFAMYAQEKRRKEAVQRGDRKDPPQPPRSERAKAILARVDDLVEKHLFEEALGLLKQGLAEEPTLKQDEEYANKLNTVTEAAKAR